MKMQPVDFQTIDEFFDYLPENERTVVEILREIVLDCMPNCHERLSYNVPYYYLRSRICFIWPSSVTWGKVKLEGVQFGFCKGHLLNDEMDYLEKGNRKEVFVKTFFKPSDIDVDLLKAYLFEAIVVDEGKKG